MKHRLAAVLLVVPLASCQSIVDQLDVDNDGVLTQEELEPIKDTGVGVVTAVGGPLAGHIAELIGALAVALFAGKKGYDAATKRAERK